MQTNLTLFSVTLPWHTRDPEQGTYATTVWASDEDAAVMLVALEMADGRGDNLTEDEKRAWASRLVESAGSAQTIVLRVADTIQQDLRELLKGPDGNAPDVEDKLREIMGMLGVSMPEARRESHRG